jgi:ABC-type transporter Mla subunit MlaD
MNPRLVALVLIPGAMLAACDNEPAGSPPPPPPAGDATPGGVTPGDLADDIGRAADSASDLFSQQLRDYRQTMADRLDTVSADIARLEARAEQLTGEARQEADNAVEALRTQRAAFAARLERASADSAAAWQELKNGLDNAWNDLKNARDAAMDRFGG